MLITRIFNRLRYLYRLRRIKNFRGLSAIPPFTDVTIAQVQASTKRLQPVYDDYISTISTREMAASLPMLAFLLSLIETGAFRKMADIGSGLSSLVLKWGSRGQPDVQVFSVDDNQEWLNKTQDFLVKHGVSSDQCITLDSYLKSRPSGFDLIFFDLNFVEIRIKYVEEVLATLRPGGVMIFDDVHKRDYLFSLLDKLNNAGIAIYSLKPVTLDEFGRFALLAVKK